MGASTDDEIFSARRIFGLKPLILSEGRLLLILEQDALDQTRFAVLQEQGKRWGELKLLLSPFRAKAMDAQIVEGDVWVASEVNTYWPIDVSRCRISDLLDPRQSPLVLQQVGQAGLSSEQAQRVMLPGSLGWSVAGPLAPSQWLFSPRFVPGEGPGTLILNTADGQAMRVSTAGLDQSAPRFALPHAVNPQASNLASLGQTVAFLRMEEGADMPFWNLSRYHGSAGPYSGALRVVENGGPELDLSQSLGLGPVFDFQLVQEREQSWIFALKKAAAGTRVAALQRGAEGWKERGALDIRKEVQMLAVAPHSSWWSLFLVVEGKAGASIHHRAWSLP